MIAIISARASTNQRLAGLARLRKVTEDTIWP